MLIDHFDWNPRVAFQPSVWFRRISTDRKEVIAVKSDDPKEVNLHTPEIGQDDFGVPDVLELGNVEDLVRGKLMVTSEVGGGHSEDLC